MPKPANKPASPFCPEFEVTQTKTQHGARRHAAPLRSLVAAGLLACGAMIGPSAQAALTFTFEFQGDFVGNASAQQAVITAGNLFSGMFASHFSDTAALTFTVDSFGGLAAAGSAGIAATGFGNGEVVRNKIVNGVDLNDTTADGFIFINLAAPFVFDPNASVDFAAGQIDFYSVIDHELTHALGFGSNIDAIGTTPAAYSKWDQFLTTKAGVAVVDPITMLVNAAAYSDAQTNGGAFSGANAIAAWGVLVPLVKSTDISHLDTDAFSSPNVPVNALMLCCGGANVQGEPRDYNAAEIGIMADLGYTRVAAVPEPSTYGLLLAGLALARLTTKRHKR